MIAINYAVNVLFNFYKLSFKFIFGAKTMLRGIAESLFELKHVCKNDSFKFKIINQSSFVHLCVSEMDHKSHVSENDIIVVYRVP